MKDAFASRRLLPFVVASFSMTALAQWDSPTSSSLSEADVQTVVKSQELLLTLKMKPAHQARLRQIMQAEWNKPGSTLPRTVQQLESGLQQLIALPERKRTLAIRSNLLPFLLRLEHDANNGDPSSLLFLEMYREAHPPVVPEAPLVSKMVADAYVDAYLFIGEIQSGRPAPRIGEASRAKLRAELARDYAKVNQANREQMTQAMQKITQFMIQWPEMNVLDRLMARASMGAKLSAEEMQAVMQVRQMQSQHSFAMVQNEINFMKQSQQTIMGSAPYWNPSANRWEQKGGIVTEFH